MRVLTASMRNNVSRQWSTYLGSKENIVRTLHTQHETVVLVANLISVATKPASAPNLVLLQPGKGIYKDSLTAHTWGRVPVFQPPATYCQQ